MDAMGVAPERYAECPPPKVNIHPTVVGDPDLYILVGGYEPDKRPAKPDVRIPKIAALHEKNLQ